MAVLLLVKELTTQPSAGRPNELRDGRPVVAMEKDEFALSLDSYLLASIDRLIQSSRVLIIVGRFMPKCIRLFQS